MSSLERTAAPSSLPPSLPPLEAYVADLLSLQATQRAHLPKAANGQPSAPSDAYAAQVMKDMIGGRSAEYRRLLSVWVCNLRDGVPSSIVTLPLRRIAAILEVESGEYRPRSLVALSRRETREETDVNLAQLRLPADENDVDALEHLVREIAQYLGVAHELKAEAERRIALVRAPHAAHRPPSAVASQTSPTLSLGALIRLK